MSGPRPRRGFAPAILLAALISGCATTRAGDDPLQYTKKLVSEGHATLYRNGAFEVPNTGIKLIPPAPDTLTLVSELAGLRAAQSFELSIKKAADSVTIVAEGTKRTYELAKDVRAIGGDAAEAIDRSMTENGKVLVYRSTDLGKSIVGRSWDAAEQVMRSDAGRTIVRGSREGANRIIEGSAAAGDRIIEGGKASGDRIIEGGIESGDRMIEGGSVAGDKIVSGSLDLAKELSSSSIDRSGRTFRFGGSRFVKGYAAVPGNVKKRVVRTGANIQNLGLISILAEENEWRKEWSQRSVILMSETLSGYPSSATSSFRKAGKEMTENYETQGVSLSVLKSLRWVLQGILWDATVEPLAKTTGAALGYLSVNLLAFPTVVVVKEGIATTQLAVQVTVDTAKTGYDIVAPTAVVAVAGALGVADMAVSQSAAAATAVVGPAAGYAEKGISAVAGVTVKGGGFVAGEAVKGAGFAAGKAVKGGGFVGGEAMKGGGYIAGQTVQYVGVPLASAGIAVGGGTIGAAVGVTGAMTGGVVVVSGKAGSATTKVFGNVVAGGTVAAGTALSAAGGAAYGVYQLSKAVVVPAGYELGSGLVLSYETLSQVSAHAILAISDCAYLVLSLEGPRWVLYAVKGNLGKGEDLPAGAILDLKKMQEQGEEIVNLPVSDEEMKKVVESVYDGLPELPAVEEDQQ